jgi:hypothetical protein
MNMDGKYLWISKKTVVGYFKALVETRENHEMYQDIW